MPIPPDDDEILDFLQDTDMIDAFDDFFDDRLRPISTDQNRSTSSPSAVALLPFSTSLRSSKYGEGDHSYVGIDLDFGLLTSMTLKRS